MGFVFTSDSKYLLISKSEINFIHLKYLDYIEVDQSNISQLDILEKASFIIIKDSNINTIIQAHGKLFHIRGSEIKHIHNITAESFKSIDCEIIKVILLLTYSYI